MQKKSERHFCLLVLGAFKPFLAVCLVMREDVEHLDRAVKNREGERPRQRTGQDREHKQVEHSHRLTLTALHHEVRQMPQQKRETFFLEGADVGRSKRKI